MKMVRAVRFREGSSFKVLSSNSRRLFGCLGFSRILQYSHRTVAGHGASHLFMKNLGVKQKSQLFSEELLPKIWEASCAICYLSKWCNFRMNCITWTHKMDVLHIAGANHAPFFQGTIFKHPILI